MRCAWGKRDAMKSIRECIASMIIVEALGTSEGRRENMGGDMTKPKTNQLLIDEREGEPPGQTLARASLDPLTRHANVARAFAEGMFSQGQRPSSIQSTS